jgi:hypothetical protein
MFVQPLSPCHPEKAVTFSNALLFPSAIPFPSVMLRRQPKDLCILFPLKDVYVRATSIPLSS